MTDFVKEHVPAEKMIRVEDIAEAVRYLLKTSPHVRRAGDPLRPTRRASRGRRMQLGVHIGYWGLGLTSADQLEIVQEAERLGYDSVWTAEAYGSDAATVLGWLAGQTSKIRLGSGIFQMPARSPAMTAMTAATIDQLSGRAHDPRHRLLRARRSPKAGTASASRTSSSARASTSRWCAWRSRANAWSFNGETLELPLPGGQGKALKLTIAPVQEHIPIYLAAIGPKNTALAGEIADGWIPTLFSPEHAKELRGALEEGAARSGRTLEGFDVAPTVNVCVDDDEAHARDLMRPFIALYVGGMGSRQRNFYNNLVQRYGFEREAKEIQDLFLEGKREEAMAAIPDGAHRHGLALRAPRSVCASGSRPTARPESERSASRRWRITRDERLEQLRLVAELAG